MKLACLQDGAGGFWEACVWFRHNGEGKTSCSSVHDPNSQKWDVDKKNGSNGRPGMIKSNKNWSWKKVTKLNMSKNNPVFFVRDKYSEPNNQQDHLNATHPGRSHLFLAMMMLCRWMRFITPWKQKDWKALCGHLESDEEVAHRLTSAHTGSHMRTCLPVICVDEPCTRKGTINESMNQWPSTSVITCIHLLRVVWQLPLPSPKKSSKLCDSVGVRKAHVAAFLDNSCICLRVKTRTVATCLKLHRWQRFWQMAC